MKPRYDYDLAVVGAGAGGLAAALAGDSLGAKTVLIEKDRRGGESLWTGSVPSKTLIKSARVYETIKRAEEFGVHVESTRLVWGAVRMRLAAVRDEIRALERKRFAQATVEWAAGAASFADAHTLRIDTRDGTRLLSARSIILATGSRVRLPEIAGLDETGFLTHETIYDVNPLPRSMLIVGGGPAGCEFGQAFQRFGCHVTLLQRAERLLPREDAEISAACRRILEQEGVTVHTGVRTLGTGSDDKGKWVEFETEDGTRNTVHAGQLLVATGKQPVLDGLNLEAAGIRCEEGGLLLDSCLRTAANNVWACGDVTGTHLFTHAAEYEGRIAARNALSRAKSKVDYRVLPWTTFTDPEVAHLGATEEETVRSEGGGKVYKAPFSELDRAIIEGETAGFAKIVTTPVGRIVGVHIIGPSAGEIIHNFIAAVRDGELIQEFAAVFHVYPTLSEIGHRASVEHSLER